MMRRFFCWLLSTTIPDTGDFYSVDASICAFAQPWGVTRNVCFLSTVIDDTTKEVVYRDYIDISVAVATPRVRWGRRWGALVLDSPFA